MRLNDLVKPSASLENSFLILACLFLAISFSFTGCSQKEKKEAPTEEKQVVTEMNIKSDDSPQPKVEPKIQPKKDEVESLPMMESEDEEEQLPVLGSGG